MSKYTSCDWCGVTLTRENDAERPYSVRGRSVFAWLGVKLDTFRRDTDALKDNIDLCLYCFADIVTAECEKARGERLRKEPSK
jgi:hypothetical protein